MASSKYPMRSDYRDFFYTVKTSEPNTVQNYVRNAFVRPIADNVDACSLEEGQWCHIEILNNQGQQYTTSGESYIETCLYKLYGNVPTHVIINQQGYISIHKYENLSIYDLGESLFHSAVRTMAVAGAFGVAFGIPGLTDAVDRIHKKYKRMVTPIWDRISPLYEMYYQTAANISRVVHLETLKKLHTLGRVLSPEYDNFWKDQQEKMSEISYSIFHDTATLQAYIRVAEMLYYTTAMSAQENLETARYESLKHGAELCDMIADNLEKYQKAPFQVWNDIYRKTFSDENIYINRYNALEGREVLEMTGDFFAKIKDFNDKYDEIQTLLNAMTMTGAVDFSTTTKQLENIQRRYYNEKIEPGIRAVEKMNNENKVLIDTLKAETERLFAETERARILAAKSSDLSPLELKQQVNQVNNLFENIISPSDGFATTARSDIEELTKGIFND